LAWAKLSDDLDEELAHLSAGAFRLYVAAITYSRRRELGGVLAQRDLDALARAQHITGPQKAIVELLDDTEDHPLWTVTDGRFTIRSYDKYNPPTSAERTRKWRAKAVTVTDGDVSVTLPRASVPALGSPVPDPVPVTRREKTANAVPKIDPFTAKIALLFEIEKASRVRDGVIHLTDERKKHGRARLAQPYPFDDCADAIRGCLADDWCRRTSNDNMAYALHTGGTLEKYCNEWRKRQPTRRQIVPLTDAERGGEFQPIATSLEAMGRVN